MTTRYNDSTDSEIRSMVYDMITELEKKFVYQQQQGASEHKQWATLKQIDVLQQVFKRMGK